MIEEIISVIIRGGEQFLLKSSLISILLVIMFIMPYSLKSWNRVIMILLMIALGFLLNSTLLLTDIITVSPKAISLAYWLIIALLFALCFYSLVFGMGRSKIANKSQTICYVLSFVFGVLNSIFYISAWGGIEGNMFYKLMLILGYTLGVFIGLILISILFFIISYILQIVLRFTQKEWALIIPSIAIGILISEILAKI